MKCKKRSYNNQESFRISFRIELELRDGAKSFTNRGWIGMGAGILVVAAIAPLLLDVDMRRAG